jgi:hypothetical protein
VIISHKARFVLLLPWKTASSTSHERLVAYNDSPYGRFFYFNTFLQRVVHQHITYPEFAALPEGRKGYFSGAFVRNPYDRVYSGFLQLQRDIQQHPTAEFPAPWIKALVMQQIAENFAQLAAAGFDFDRWFGLIEEHQIYEVGRNSSFPLHPAHYWTGLDREQNVNFVGRVENFDHDFSAFCSNVRVTPADVPNSNVSNVVVDVSTTASSRYLSKMNTASISKVNALFSVDFELFGYKKYV